MHVATEAESSQEESPGAIRELGRHLGSTFPPMRKDQAATVRATLTESMSSAARRSSSDHRSED